MEGWREGSKRGQCRSLRKMQFSTWHDGPCSILKPGEKEAAPQYGELFVWLGLQWEANVTQCDSSSNPAHLSTCQSFQLMCANATAVRRWV